MRNAAQRTEQPPARRRVLLGMTAAAGALLAAGCSSSGDGDGTGSSDGGQPGASPSPSPSAQPGKGPDGALAANFNEDPRGTTPEILKGVGAAWVRGFVPMPEIGHGPAEKQRAVAALLSFHDAGYGTVLSLKFPSTKKPLPTPGSSAMDEELKRVDQVLDAVLGKVDVLAVGNEPFLESGAADQRSGRFNAFYEALAGHVVKRRKERFRTACRTRLFMGAMNRLEDPKTHDAAHERWMKYVRETREIEGVDIHPHVAAIGDADAYVKYVLPRMRPEQKFLATEFSLVHLWHRHLGDPVPAAFAKSRGLAAATPFWKALRDAAAHPLPQEEWKQLLLGSAWFDSHRHYLANQVKRFRATGRLAVACYGVAQGPAMVRRIGPDFTPWLLNSVYSNLTAQPSADGRPAPNPAWFDEFRTLQRPSDRLPIHTGTTPV